jgi:hypothetical protein
MELKRTVAALLSLLWGAAAAAQSTVNPNVPVAGQPVENSGPLFRSNFQAAVNDINTLFGLIGGSVVISGTPMVGWVPTATGPTTATWQAPTGGGGGSVANPTASVGLAAVNGVATSAIRSDGAPALSQSIAPTWTGLHNFAVSPTVPTVAPGTNTTAVASTAFVGTAIGNIFTSTHTWLAPQTFNNAPVAVPTAAPGTNDTQAASTAFVTTAVAGAGGFAGFANPTASLGLSAINGVAVTAMRSDAAPALSQSIAPTWSGLHNFSVSPTVPTPAPGTNNSQAAPTAFVTAAINALAPIPGFATPTA